MPESSIEQGMREYRRQIIPAEELKDFDSHVRNDNCLGIIEVYWDIDYVSPAVRFMKKVEGEHGIVELQQSGRVCPRKFSKIRALLTKKEINTVLQQEPQDLLVFPDIKKGQQRALVLTSLPSS